jgi:uncharacterized protein YodC (DUF2158 family)
MNESDVEIKPGDTVILKSGGPLMTVYGTDLAEQEVWCNWMDGSGQKQVASFSPSMLRKKDKKNDRQ